MTRIFFPLAAALLVAAPANADPREASPDDPTCRLGGKPAVQVRVSGLKNGSGTLRVQAYGPGPRGFLKKGAWVGRVDVPLNGRRSVEVCLPLPVTGSYAIAIRHDANANHKSDWNDGAAFSRNPRLGLTSKPSFGETSIRVGNAPARISVVLNYRRGLTVAPIN